MINTKISADSSRINYEYKGNKYALTVDGAKLSEDTETITVNGAYITLTPTKI